MKFTFAMLGVGVTNAGGAVGQHNLAFGVILSIIGGALVGIAIL